MVKPWELRKIWRDLTSEPVEPSFRVRVKAEEITGAVETVGLEHVLDVEPVLSWLAFFMVEGPK